MPDDPELQETPETENTQETPDTPVEPEYPDLIVPYCTKTWADKYFSEVHFSEAWNDASNEKRISALKSSTCFIDRFVQFYDEKGDPVQYVPDGTDDFTNEIIPRLLKEACAAEAVYLLSLDDNPAEPHPLTILGMISADGKHFDHDFTPPIFSAYVVKLLNLMGADIDPEATANNQMQTAGQISAF